MGPGSDARAVVDLLSDAEPGCGDMTIVAIDGPSGAGKTSLANAVAELVRESGRSVGVVHADELLPGWDGLSALPTLLAEQVLDPLCRGERAAFRAWDWEADAWGETHTVKPSDVLVVEGCGCSARPAGNLVSVRVWVDAPVAQRYSRAIARDGEVFAVNWERWAAQERELFARDGTRARADLVVQT